MALAALAIVNAEGKSASYIGEDNFITEARLARPDGLAFLDTKINTGRIDCYAVEDGEKIRLDPDKRLYALVWLHNVRPPDFELRLIREPIEWFNPVMAALIVAVRERFAGQLSDGRHHENHRR